MARRIEVAQAYLAEKVNSASTRYAEVADAHGVGEASLNRWLRQYRMEVHVSREPTPCTGRGDPGCAPGPARRLGLHFFSGPTDSVELPPHGRHLTSSRDSPRSCQPPTSRSVASMASSDRTTTFARSSFPRPAPRPQSPSHPSAPAE
jgi:hypothetical protein